MRSLHRIAFKRYSAKRDDVRYSYPTWLLLQQTSHQKFIKQKGYIRATYMLDPSLAKDNFAVPPSEYHHP